MDLEFDPRTLPRPLDGIIKWKDGRRSRITAWELQRTGVPCTLITDSMAGHVMQRGLMDTVIVGADRVAANGDTAN